MATFPESRRTRMKGLGVACAAGLLLAGCAADFTRNDQSDVILRITKITGSSGGTGSGSGITDVLNSDVSPVFNDNATVEMAVIAKSPSTEQVLSSFNDVELTRYEVVYTRSDGRNVEGVDVPYRISGPVATLIAANGTGGTSIVVVRHQAKEEPPLRNLKGIFVTSAQAGVAPQFGGAVILTVNAQITIYGTTTAGQTVSARGSLQINFADFADQ